MRPPTTSHDRQSSRDAAALWAYDLVMREAMGWDGATQVIP